MSKNANYRKHNDHTHNSSTYHKKDGTPIRTLLKREAQKQIQESTNITLPQSNMNAHISNVCRVNITPEITKLATSAGIHEIPHDLMPPRQVKVVDLSTMSNESSTSLEIQAILKWHRDAWVATISRDNATKLVQNGNAQWQPQSLLVYEMENYLADSDVQEDQEELAKATQAAEDGATTVIVAVIGDSRSTLSVCRNIVSGCQDNARLVDDAKGAIEAHSCFIVED